MGKRARRNGRKRPLEEIMDKRTDPLFAVLKGRRHRALRRNGQSLYLPKTLMLSLCLLYILFHCKIQSPSQNGNLALEPITQKILLVSLLPIFDLVLQFYRNVWWDTTKMFPTACSWQETRTQTDFVNWRPKLDNKNLRYVLLEISLFLMVDVVSSGL